jgi:GNAT superfamily N-acetyltransferase
MPTIRPVRADELLPVQALLHRAHAWNLANGFNFTAADIGETELAARLDPAHFFVAEHDGRLVGSIEVKPEKDGPDWGFHLLAVDPESAVKGVGRALIAHAEALRKERGAPRMVLDTPQTHPWLPAYYAGMGYATFATVQWEGKKYRSVLMAKELN